VVAAEAVDVAEVTSDSVTRLGVSSVEIGSLVKVITQIAELARMATELQSQVFRFRV
jgi:hypothetical protein